MKKQTVLITGATAGIGKATAEIFAKNKYNVVITGRRSDRLAKIKAVLETHNVNVITHCFDIRNQKQVQLFADSLIKQKIKVDILVNNAGLSSGLNEIQNGDINDWEIMIDTNIKGLLYISRAIIPWMIKNKKGHIVNVSSIAGKEVYANGNVYCATKHAVDALSKSMRIDLLKEEIKVTNIAPGMVETEFGLVRFKGDKVKAASVYKGLVPLKAKDIAETIYWTTTRPAHVNINDITIMCTAQASAKEIIRK